ncbi:MAG: dehydrogenase [Bacteroidetes bacterium]|nr:dehydrogenase [Bacteroidota bacterium]
MSIAFRDFYHKEDLYSIYSDLITPRIIEERMLKLLRQNKISKWFSGIGQEAISVGVVKALSDKDYILPMHRNLGVFTSRKVDFYKLFCQLFGKRDGFTRGRERSFHFGAMEYHIIGMISHLGAMLPVADGLALANKLRKEKQVVVAFTGDGATSEGDFHEALNIAAVWKLPVIFIIENNGYGLSTPSTDQFACLHLADKGIGYGIEAVQLDGNSILEVHHRMKEIRKKVIETQNPILVEMKTFRMRGHEEASGMAYVPKELVAFWKTKDPIFQFEKLLLSDFDFTQEELNKIKKSQSKEIDSHIEKALACPLPTTDSISVENEVLAPFKHVFAKQQITENLIERRFVDALSAGLKQAFTEDESVLMMGQDIAAYGGVFKLSQGFLEEFGKERIRNTPIIESGIVGAAYGLALAGFKPIVEMQFADFITVAFNQIVNNLAKSYYRWSGPINVTIRAPHGAGVGAGPFHSQSPEAWFMQHPGLKVIVPSSVQDAQDMLYTAIQDPNPVLLFEHKKLYRSLKETVSEKAQLIDYSKSKLIHDGTRAVIITFGMGVHWANDLVKNNPDYNDIAILDLRSLSPIDYNGIKDIVKKTGKVLLLEEHGGLLGPMSEISRHISEYCFELLDAPVMTCSSMPTPIPTNTILEADFLASSRLEDKLNQLLMY